MGATAGPSMTGANDVQQSVIGEDLTIEGSSITIRCRGALCINGNIQAELHSQELVVGPSGTVSGSIAADKVDVHGKVSGTIMGTKVVLYGTADVEGDIHAKSLRMEDGAGFEGRSRRVADSDIITPQLVAAEPGPVVVPVPVKRDVPISGT